MHTVRTFSLAKKSAAAQCKQCMPFLKRNGAFKSACFGPGNNSGGGPASFRCFSSTGDGDEGLFEAVDSRMVCPRTCWVIGSEAHGVSEEACQAADIAVRIPMAPTAESLNAAVSASVILYVLAHGARSGAFGPNGFR